ncbi:MAG: NAD(P)-binding protein [Gammaproteobacteria bacterium]|nr:NAD(P)-binding protein [Gammaproteobacteria bacterium]
MRRIMNRRQLLKRLTGIAFAPSIIPRINATPLSEKIEHLEDYPPALTGMRGNHDGSFQHMHRLRDGNAAVTGIKNISEHYDLVVVGAGISGFAAAYFHQQRAEGKARILILDNHDDFGGNARRNEFTHDGRSYICYAGSQSLNSSSMGPVVDELLSTLKIDFQQFHQAYDKNFYADLKLQRGVFFNSENFAEEKLVRGAPFDADDQYMIEAYEFDAEKFAKQTPLSRQGKKDLCKLLSTKKDYFEGKSLSEKKKILGHISYADYLRNHVQVSEEVIDYYEHKTLLRGLGASVFPARMAMSMGLPGFDGLKIETQIGHSEPYIYHFPDGNGSIPRLIANHFIPDLANSDKVEDVLTAKFNYAKLDRPDQFLRIRLNSTVVNVASQKDHVKVTYADKNEINIGVTADRVVLACPHVVIPHICPALPKSQKDAMREGVRVPVVYTHVLLRKWDSFVKAGVSSIYCPGNFFHEVSLDYPVSMGSYQFSADPQQPIVIHMEHVPYTKNTLLTAREQYRLGRHKLLQMSLENMEREVRMQLDNMLGKYGFRSERDILDITINRWAHGASYILNGIFDDKTEEENRRIIARKSFGRITIANADAGATTSLDTAVNEAYRAVSELWA